MNSTAALITLADNVFRTVAVNGGEGLYSPRTGNVVERKTGYVVGAGDVVKINKTLSLPAQFSAIVEFIANNSTAATWATAEPLYLTAGHDEEGDVLLAWGHIVNDRAEAIRLALANRDPFVGDIANDSVFEIEFPSAAAEEFLAHIARKAERAEIIYATDPSGPPLHDIPGLQTNPWDTPYNRTHL